MTIKRYGLLVKLLRYLYHYFGLAGAQSPSHKRDLRKDNARNRNILIRLPQRIFSLLGTALWSLLTFWPLWRRVALYGSSVSFAALTLAFLGFFHLARQFTPETGVDLWQINRPPSIVLLSYDLVEIGVRGSHYGDPVPLDELPPYVAKAFIATEDRRFFRHAGFDLRGFLRALLRNINAGRVVQGGSTISQQLAKNLFLTADRTYIRKLREIQLALWLETHYSKKEILSLYLNRTYLGAGAYGIEAAANVYFSKSARDLTLSEAALLAGLPKAPSSLAPTRNFDGALARTVEVIDNLVEAKELDSLSAELAKRHPPQLDPRSLNTDFGYFVDAALIQASTIIGAFDTDLILTTTIHPDTQHKAVQAVTQNLSPDILALNAEQAALIAYENATGAIIAMVGGVSYEKSQFNRATHALRQPGSVFKPFVYLAALEAGMTPRTLMVDQPIVIENWRPTNYSKTHQGPVRLSYSMAQSINTTAVQIMETVGRDKVVAAAQRLGITRPLQQHPSLALGAMEVTLDEITSAYLPFSNGGLAATPHLLTKIETRSGELLYEWSPPKASKRLIDADVNQQMTHLLYQVIHSGTGQRAALGTRKAAGKTGTTNDWRDAWFIGYTPQITAGIWVGNDEAKPMQKITGGMLPAVIWRDFMSRAHDGRPLAALPGATPAPDRDDQLRLVQFYNSLLDDFHLVESDKNRMGHDVETGENDSGAKTSSTSPPPKHRKWRWWPFGRTP